MTYARFLYTFSLMAGVVLFSALFQSCDNNVKLKGKDRASVTSRQGNGDFYGGKVEIYTYSDRATPCAQLDLKGNPFPNRQIQYSAATDTAYLVRSACTDMEPVSIPNGQFSYNPVEQSISYQNQVFNLQTDFSDLNIIPARCPAPMQPFTTAANILTAGLNFSDPSWTPSPGIRVDLFGTIAALPRYQVFRNDPNLLEFYRRISQKIAIPGGVRYAASFLLSRGNTGSASFIYWDTDAYEIDAHLDLTTGVATITNLVGFQAAQVSLIAEPYGAGYNITLFFEKPAASGNSVPDLGVAPTNYVNMVPQRGQLGDYLYATAASLRVVDDYCQ
ncbi:MAG: hypothetical protein AB7F86_09470 [Bdellovibrionales bacterium]